MTKKITTPGPATVPSELRTQFPQSPVVDRPRLGYGPDSHPRKLDPMADAQSILDTVVNNHEGVPGIEQRRAYDGGFRVKKYDNDPDAHRADRGGAVLHGHHVVGVLDETAAHYDQKAAKLQGSDPQGAALHQTMADDIRMASKFYAVTMKGYWDGAQGTPSDIAGTEQGAALLRPDGGRLDGRKNALGK